MDSKLIQEVNSCLSVPADEDTQTRKCLLTVTLQANNSKQDILTIRHLTLESVFLLWKQDKQKQPNTIGLAGHPLETQNSQWTANGWPYSWEPWQPLTCWSSGTALICYPSRYPIINTTARSRRWKKVVPTKPEICTKGSLSETSGAGVIHSKRRTKERQDRGRSDATSQHIRWSACCGRGEATVLGFLLTSFRLASSQVGVTLKFEIWYRCLRFLRVRVS